jgi:hypothetical protein
MQNSDGEMEESRHRFNGDSQVNAMEGKADKEDE